jgi:hypothetical protein
MFPLLSVLAVSLLGGLAAGPSPDVTVVEVPAGEVGLPQAAARSVVFPSPFTACPVNTGGSATILLPLSAVGVDAAPLLDSGDEVAVLAPDGSCVGHAVWDGDGVAFSVWTDDPFTTARDGMRPGDPLALSVWDASEAQTLAPEMYSVVFEDEFSPASGFESDGLYIVEQAQRVPATSSTGGGPALTALEQNRPNPVRGQTAIAFTLADAAHVTLDVFDALGRRVAQVLDQEMPAGPHEVALDGSALSPGVYVYRLGSADATLQRRMTVAR